MEPYHITNDDSDQKPNFESGKQICRGCLSTERHMLESSTFAADFLELSGINLSECDGLPRWLCWECRSLVRKAARFRRKLLRAHRVLYDYLTRCAPFPIDGTDPELSRYCSPELGVTPALAFDNATAAKTTMGFHEVLEHQRVIKKSELEGVELPVTVDKEEGSIKDEAGFSDYEDNITLEEYRCNVNGAVENSIDTSAKHSQGHHNGYKKEKKKKKDKKKEHKIKKDKTRKNIETEEPPDTSRRSIRKLPELDPSKIKVVVLDPAEQVRQREEESKVGLKYPFKCNLCFKGFNFEVKLKNHMTKHSPSRGSFECKLCCMYLPTQYSLSVHTLIHTRRYECVPCGRRMIDRASILDHYRTQHEGMLNLFTCNLCGKVSNNSKTHRGHMRNHHAGARPRCNVCGKTFVNKDSLVEHHQIHLGIKNYECAECGARFRTRTQIKHHQLKHSSAKEYYCVECDVRFKSAHNLRQHLTKSLKHKDRQSFQFACTVCGSRFETAARLRAHARVQHEGVREWTCALCPAALASRASLAKHERAVHAGHRPAPKHVCDTCGKAFRGKSVLTNHVRTHTGEKPFACHACGRAFSQRTALRTHHNLVHLKLKRNHKIKPDTTPEFKLCPDEPPGYPWSRPAPPSDVYFTVTAGP